MNDDVCEVLRLLLASEYHQVVRQSIMLSPSSGDAELFLEQFMQFMTVV